MGFGNSLDERLHGSAIGDVTRLDLARPARTLDRSVDGREALGCACDKDDMASVFGKAFCDGAADAAAGSSDDGDALDDDGSSLATSGRRAGILLHT